MEAMRKWGLCRPRLVATQRECGFFYGLIAKPGRMRMLWFDARLDEWVRGVRMALAAMGGVVGDEPGPRSQGGCFGRALARHAHAVFACGLCRSGTSLV